MRKQETKQSIMSSTSAFWLPVPLQKGLVGLKSKAWWEHQHVILKRLCSDISHTVEGEARRTPSDP